MDDDSDEESGTTAVEVRVQQTKVPVASEYGTKLFFNLCKMQNHEQTCAICLESCLECAKCMALLVPCMHTVHLACLYKMERPQCPVCRR